MFLTDSITIFTALWALFMGLFQQAVVYLMAFTSWNPYLHVPLIATSGSIFSIIVLGTLNVMIDKLNTNSEGQRQTEKYIMIAYFAGFHILGIALGFFVEDIILTFIATKSDYLIIIQNLVWMPKILSNVLYKSRKI
jgi:hypothetical protein